MFDKLQQIVSRYEDLGMLMAKQEVVSNPDEYRRVTMERAQIEELVETYREYTRLGEEIESNRELTRGDDPDVAELAREELPSLEERFHEYEEKLRMLLLPKDPLDDKNVLLEIRAGAGGVCRERARL